MATTLNHPVVVGFDGSEGAQRALAYAAWEATRRSVPLRMIYGYQPVALYGPGLVYASNVELTLTWARDMLTGAADKTRAELPGLEVSEAVIAGGPAATLLGQSQDASLLVVGSRGRGGFAAMLMGSVCAQVAAHATTPVVIVRAAADPDGPYDNGPILVGVDGSEGAQDALEFAFEQAAARNVPLFAVYVWGVLPKNNLGPISDGYYDSQQAQDEAERLLSEALAGWRSRYPDVEVDTLATHSFGTVETLVQLGSHAGMIVVGPRGRGGFAALLLGSTADGVVRHADRTVAIAHRAS